MLKLSGLGVDHSRSNHVRGRTPSYYILDQMPWARRCSQIINSIATIGSLAPSSLVNDPCTQVVFVVVVVALI